MRPIAPHAFAMTVRDALFAHWPFDPGQLRPHVPEPLELDTHDGRAWVSVVPFVLADAGLRYTPDAARLTFPEVNLRTYVQLDGQSGLYFFSIDVDSALVARSVRATTRLPVYRADARARSHDGHVEFRSERRGDPAARFAATYRPDGDVFHAEPGSLDHWLAERRRMYAPEAPGSRVLYADISHDRWPLRPADVTVQENTLFEAADLPAPDGDPRFRYSREQSMTGSVPRRLE